MSYINTTATNNNIEHQEEGNSVIIPINPEILFNSTQPQALNEFLEGSGLDNVLLPDMEIIPESAPGNQWTSSTPLFQENVNVNKPHLHDNNNNNGNSDNNGNNNTLSLSVRNNSNGNGNINKPPGNPNENNNTFCSDYTQSPFNPLVMTPPSTTSSEYNYTLQSVDENNSITSNERLSLASNQFKLFVDDTLKRVCSEKSLKSRLIVSNAQESNTRWGLKIFGPRADLVQTAKQEIMRSPALNCNCSSQIEEDYFNDDMESRLQTSRTIESILFEDGDMKTTEIIQSKEVDISSSESIYSSIDFPTLTSLTGLLLGPKYHVIKDILVKFDCNITWEGSLAFQPVNSSINIKITGTNAKNISRVIDCLKERSDLIDEQALKVTTLIIEAGKIDWIYSSGALKQVEAALWNSGASLTHIKESVYQVTCLSGALLTACLKKLHVILSGYRSAHFTLNFRNDYRDFSSKCSAILDSLARWSDCAVVQRCGEGFVEIELGGTSENLTRALTRLDTFRSQIFESGTFDLKVTERRLRMHVPADIRDFISGKKDGKLNRIVKETGVDISLNMIGGDSMYVDLSLDGINGNGNNDFGSTSLLHAIGLIEGELPSELTFHVPEVHHKRMIGHGGKVIQRIMKKWGVYVKFMNTFETSQCHLQVDPLVETSSASDRRPLDNVIVRTPSKNASALQAIKDEIFEECSIFEINGQFDPVAFRALKRFQDSAKTRVSIGLQGASLRGALSCLQGIKSVDCHLRAEMILLEGSKEAILEAINVLSEELKDELVLSTDGSTQTYTVRSPSSPLMHSYSPNYLQNNTSSSCLSEDSFKFFPSALFVVQCMKPSLSASGSPILSSSASSYEMEMNYNSPASSIAMNSINSLNSSPPLPVGHQKQQQQQQQHHGGLLHSRSEESNSALAETRRRSADIF